MLCLLPVVVVEGDDDAERSYPIGSPQISISRLQLCYIIPASWHYTWLLGSVRLAGLGSTA